jgi:hypothetical protein
MCALRATFANHEVLKALTGFADDGVIKNSVAPGATSFL